MTDPTSAPGLEELLEFLKRTRSFDFTGYKRESLQRRIRKRMQEVGISDFADYIDHLEVHPDEFIALFNTILINVTAFFRDPDCWEYLADTIIPAILAEKSTEDPIRIWSAGCASGEEAYSIAILTAEALGISDFRRRVKIYATDVDEQALEEARRALYSEKDLAPVSEERREHFFEPNGKHFAFRRDLRRSVIFGRHDLVKDPPMSRLDLIVCRNVLMYLNAATQANVLARLHFALNPSGILFLGRAEMLLSHANLFAPIELRHRIFSKLPAKARTDQLASLAHEGNAVAKDRSVGEFDLLSAAFDAMSDAQLVVDATGNLVLTNRAARELFHLEDSDRLRPLRDLEMSYRPLELRSLIDEAYQKAKVVRVPSVELARDGKSESFDVAVIPLRRNGEMTLGVSISFINVTARQTLRSELLEVEGRFQELNQAFQSASEELETTNEELQSTNEELETTNEELQSSNEELETINEELQSTNEELRTMNDELHQQSRQVDESNAFLESVLAGLRAACIVVDSDSRVRVWKEKAEDLWGLRAEEAEGHLLPELDIALPMSEVQEEIAACIHGERSLPSRQIETLNRRGKRVRCALTATPLRDLQGEIRGAILLIEPMGGDVP
jgi:two-component system CheB/CheR fusion protein